MVYVFWECGGRSGITYCSESEQQKVVDQLLTAGYIIISIGKGL